MHRRGRPLRHKPHTFKTMTTTFEVAKFAQETNKSICKKGSFYTRVGLPGSWNLDEYDNILYDEDFEAGYGKDKVIYGNPNNDVIFGSEGDDEIYSSRDGQENSNTGSKNLIFAGGGNDSVQGDAGDDTIYGEMGTDILQGGYGNDTIFGGNGADQIDGGIGDDRLYGGSGADQLRGGKGNDIIDGGSGKDGIFAFFGSDELIGGEGIDQFNVNFEQDAQGRFAFHRVRDFESGETIKLEASDAISEQELEIHGLNGGSQLVYEGQTLLVIERVDPNNLILDDRAITYI